MYCGRIQRAEKFDCIAQNAFDKTSAKHRKTPQNSHKTRFMKLRRKTPQNKRKTLKKVTKPSHYSRSRNTYCAHSVYSSKILLDLSQKYTMRKTCKLRITGGCHVPSQVVTVKKKTEFCGVLRCFAVFCGVLCACF